MRILFMGTPEFALPSLKALFTAGHEICAVYTQPDKPKNRGMKLQAPPVKEYALTINAPVFQPLSLKDEEEIARIEQFAPELIVVAAYGKLLPQAVLSIPKHGCINVHSSLLPKYRGAAPINWALMDGQEKSGVTIMYMAPKLDAGDILLQVETDISISDDAVSLHNRLALLGSEALLCAISQIEDGTAAATPQNEDEVTYAAMLSRALSPLDFQKDAFTLHNQIRGLTPWPACTAEIDGVMLKIYASMPQNEKTDKQAGTILSANKDGIQIACGNQTILLITQVQAENARRMSAADYLRGHPIHVDT